MSETIKTSEEIVLFGREITDLTVAHQPDAAKETKEEEKKKKTKHLARIYGFSFDGAYYDMLSPVLFEVTGPGEEAKKATVPGPGEDQEQFVKSLKTWTVNMNDKSIRLDVETGKFENILLAGMAGDGSGVSGARVSGARVSGARVSGARVSGARVSGARVSGARVSGARISDD